MYMYNIMRWNISCLFEQMYISNMHQCVTCHLDTQWTLSTTRPSIPWDTCASSMQYLHFDWTIASGAKNGRESVVRLLSVARKSLSVPSLEVTTLQYTLPFFRLVTWSTISAATGLTTSIKLCLCDRTSQSLSQLIAQTLSIASWYPYKCIVTVVNGLHRVMLFDSERDDSHLQLAKGVGDAVRETREAETRVVDVACGLWNSKSVHGGIAESPVLTGSWLN